MLFKNDMTKEENAAIALKKFMSYPKKRWVGVDFDKTLSTDESGGNWDISKTGKPNKHVVDSIKYVIKKGLAVRVFTARAFNALSGENTLEEAIGPIERWCQEHLGQVLPVTCIKDYNMIQLWDDRARTVIDGKVIFNRDIKKLIRFFNEISNELIQ